MVCLAYVTDFVVETVFKGKSSVIFFFLNKISSGNSIKNELEGGNIGDRDTSQMMPVYPQASFLSS